MRTFYVRGGWGSRVEGSGLRWDWPVYTESCKLAAMSEERAEYRTRPAWDGAGVRALRKHLGLSQGELALEMGIRQQTVSEWETGRYRPRGASAKLLSLVAERAGFEYGSGQDRGDAGG